MRVNYNSIEKQNTAWAYILFFIWPLLALIVSFKNLGYKYSRVIIILFFGLFGYTFIFNEMSDSYRHAESFKLTATKPFGDFFNIVSGLYSEEGTKPDFVMDLISFIVTRFTDNTKIYFMVLSLILGWMLMVNIKLLLSLYEKNKTAAGIIFIAFLIIIMPPSRILSFRHYLGLLVFVYSLYKYFTEKKLIYLLLLTFSIFIHFGFLMLVGLFYIYKLCGRQNRVYYILIILSFIFYEQSATLLKSYGVGLGGLDKTVRGYTHEKYLERVAGYQNNRNIIINSYARWTTLFMILSLIYHKLRIKNFDKVSEYLYSFLLLFFAFVNFMQGLEAIANRFSVVFQVLSCVFYVHLYSQNNVKIPTVFRQVSLIFLLLNAVVLIRVTFEYTNMLVLVPFVPVSLLVDSDSTILNLIK
ncbi:hypothetical protein CHU92_14640 [Flavobacterium cyanobacteriorum]|uniref:EpsG family protein n=1 Tax=Flavobacterium cyanobacteriorum TaxID=2022802 RepID=A0A255YUL1_9FLAO|nr:EpsG family protein [Flavobacterium cyanobacteriorum]OYQ32110.1 hypothetical protein CHU92_14640 [Flavobacterium cyanobacteriorum]